MSSDLWQIHVCVITSAVASTQRSQHNAWKNYLATGEDSPPLVQLPSSTAKPSKSVVRIARSVTLTLTASYYICEASIRELSAFGLIAVNT